MRTIFAAVTGSSVSENATWETQLEVDALFHLREPRIIWRGVFHCVHFRRFLAGKIAACLERINADVHKRAAPGLRLFQPPLCRIADIETCIGLDDLNRT